MFEKIKKNRNLQLAIAAATLIIIIVGGVLVWQVFLPDPQDADIDDTPEVIVNDDTSGGSIDVDTIPVNFEDVSTAIPVGSLTRCVNINLMTSGWNTEEGRTNISLLSPTMFRVFVDDLVAQYEAEPQSITDYITFTEESAIETLFVLDISEEEDLNLSYRVLNDYQELGGIINRIEVVSNFEGLYENKLFQFLDDVKVNFPGAEIILSGFPDLVDSLEENFDFDAFGVRVAYESEISGYEQYSLEFANSLNQPEQAVNELVNNIETTKPLYVTSFRLDEDLLAPRGEEFAPFRNLQLGGTWGQAIATSFGYFNLLVNEIEVICIESLSSSPQNSLYFLEENIQNSTYTVLDGDDYEFTPTGQAFFMLSKAIIRGDEDETDEFVINNESGDVLIWVFNNGDELKAWVINGRAGQTALNLEKYGFIANNIEMKSAPPDKVIFNRDDIDTVFVDDFNESKILIDPYSISVLDLENIEGFNAGSSEDGDDGIDELEAPEDEEDVEEEVEEEAVAPENTFDTFEPPAPILRD